MDTLITPFYVSEVLAALVATLCFNKYRNSPLWLILPILWLAVFAETAGGLYKIFIYPNNLWIFNIYAILYYILFYYMIYGFVTNKKRRFIIMVLSIVVLFAFIINIWNIDPRYQPLTYAEIIGTIVLVIHLLYAAIEVLKSDKILKIRNSLPFFIFSGYLLITITLIPVSIVWNLELHVWSEEVYKNVHKILTTVIVIANCYFIFGFLWTKPDKSF